MKYVDLLYIWDFAVIKWLNFTAFYKSSFDFYGIKYFVFNIISFIHNYE